MANITVTAEELNYLDKAANSDKFYRVFSWGTTSAVQYGRGGTAGTFKRTTCESEGAALAASSKQANKKFSGGYERVKSAILAFDTEPTDRQLDAAMNRAPASLEASDASGRQATLREAAVVRLNQEDFVADPAIMSAVTAALTAVVGPAVHESKASGEAVRPMLAETLPKGDLERYLTDDNQVVQLKVDGDRFVIDSSDGQVTVFNRQGVPKTSNVAEAVLVPFRHLTSGRFVVDGEIVAGAAGASGPRLILFDILEAGGHIGRNSDFVTRHAALVALMSVLDGTAGGNVVVLPYVAGTAAKRAALAEAREQNREGIMFRNGKSLYQPGRRSLNLLKHKFEREIDVFVKRLGTKAGKQNAEMAVYDDNGEEVILGPVSIVGKGDLDINDVLIVKFLYTVGESTKLFQPRIVRRRTDKSPAECSIHQLDGSATNKTI